MVRCDFESVTVVGTQQGKFALPLALIAYDVLGDQYASWYVGRQDLLNTVKNARK